MVVAAFFDLDRTVISGSSLYPIARAAFNQGVYKRRQLVKDAWAQLLFRQRSASDSQTHTIREQVQDHVRGHRQSEVAKLSPEVLVGCLRNLYPRMYDIIHDHERAGVRTYLCSASPVETVSKIADVLDMSGGAIATTAEVAADGCYTGLLSGPFVYGEGKAEAVRIEAARAGIDLGSSYAYSDSISDLPLLEVVGHPVTVNPDAELARISAERGWESIRVEPRLLRRLAIASSVMAGAAGAGVGGWFAYRHFKPRRRLRWPIR